MERWPQARVFIRKILLGEEGKTEEKSMDIAEMGGVRGKNINRQQMTGRGRKRQEKRERGKETREKRRETRDNGQVQDQFLFSRGKMTCVRWTPVRTMASTTVEAGFMSSRSAMATNSGFDNAFTYGCKRSIFVEAMNAPRCAVKPTRPR
ncbi:hypothetical protein BC940DRAFT_301056 [Gongronella butleri]|nr:hypothetical protein BC940DRAFT_301056 [Gongronella butleri]